MAFFNLNKGIIDGTQIDIYNNGDMYRDFTYVEDLVQAIYKLIDVIPGKQKHRLENDSLSPVAPHRIVNIGNSDKIRLLDFIEAIEEELNKKAIRNYLPMQEGDVPATWADADLLFRLTKFKPNTSYKQGVKNFVNWYRDYFSV